jgi:molybdate transport system permease protein
MGGMPLDLEPLWLTFRLSGITTLILLVMAIPLAFWLTRLPSALRFPLHALINMPLVLPPTVIGFYLLVLLSPTSFLGHFLKEAFGATLVFSFAGLVVGSVFFSLPFMINPVVSGLESLPASLTEAAHVLGKSKWETLFRVLLPNIRPSLLAGGVLAFAHTVGEFGVALMIGGGIPGKTRVASIAVYDEVESFHYAVAHAYSAILCLFCFGALMALMFFNRKWQRPI